MTCQNCTSCTCPTPTRDTSTPPPTPTGAAQAAQFIRLTDAARRVGLTSGALSRRLNRFEQRPDGFPIRRPHGLVHVRDFENWMQTLARPSKATSAAAYVRQSVRQMEGR